MATSATTTGTNEAAGGSGLKQPDKQRRLSPSTSSPPSDPLLASAVSIGGHGNSVEAANRQHLQRISESPAPISQSQINAMASGTDKPSSGASAADSTARSDRMGVSESIARQSHLDDHVRTFKGIGNQEQQQFHGQPQQQPQQQQQHRQQQQQQQQQPSSHHHPILNHQLQVGAIAMPSAGPLAQRHLGFNGGIAGESDFQLTLPGRKQVTPVGAVLTQPPVPSEYNSSSPQNPKAAWLTDRVLLTHVPESSPRGLRRGYYYPYNPCNPALYPLPHTELSQRWAFAFANYSSLSSYTPKWRSLCTPASLPLVTDYFPTDLETYYQLYTYHLQTPDIAMEDLIELPPEDFAEFVPFMAGRAAAEAAAARYRELTGESARIDQSTRIMLKEMIYQRLAQGFQFIATRESRATRGIRDITARAGARAAPLFKSGNRSDTGGDPYMPVVPVGLIDKLDESVWLSNGREIQKLEFHNGTNTSHVPGVNVSRWERKKPYDRADVEYRFQMWSRSNNMGYGKANVRFTYPREDEVNWNNLDYLLNGYQNAPLKSMKYWRARYILIPVDQLSNDTFVNAKANPHMSIEDVRIANFEKFLDHIIRRLRKSDKADLEEAFLGALPAEMRRSVLGQQQQQQPATTTQAQQKPGSNGGSSESQKLIGLQDIVPSALLQIRYTSLCPIAYNNNQLHCYMNDKIYSDPSNKIVLPPPVTSALGLSVPLNVESPFSQLAFALQHPVAGIALRNIRWHTSYFEAAFISFQLVDWALVNFESAMKRTQAATLANRLLERGLIYSLNKPGPFADGYYFYAFTDAAVAWKSQPIHQQQAPRTHASLISSIGFSDLGGRNGSGGSNAASPCVSRPESRQGSNAPSVANDADSIMAAPSAADSPALTTAATFEGNASAAHNNSSSSGTTSVVSNANNKSNDTGSAPLMRRQTTASRVPGLRDSVQESQSDTRSAGAQPASRLRVRTDTPASATQVNVERKDMSGEGASSRGDGSANVGDGDRSTRDKGRLVQSGNNTAPMSTLVIAPGERRAIEAAAGQKVPSPALASKEGGYTRAPDVFPCLSQRKTRRPLPKSLTQSRMFALDLDQQRKSTRIEQCLVHLDATQNPMTCFHLSINWLNCTSHLIDELVQGWGRVAERCGMRLVEAPRAQDSYAHENHPFHSPLRINLVLAPPPVDEIFDDAWIAEFAHYGDDDSEPDEYTSESEESDVGFHTAAEQSELEIRTRILRRLKRSIPSYPFERELLEEHDFILDVEAESEFPSSSLLQREYTFERAEHKYTQYIHRSGTAFVRICGPGKYMWINNYLLTSHQGHLRPQASQTAQQTIPATGAGTAAGGAAAAAAASGGVQQQQHQHQQPGAMGAFGLHGDGVMAGLAGTAPGPSDGGLMATIFDSEGLGLSSAYGLETAGSLVPSYYPVHQSRGMWPHQMLMSLSLYRSPSRRFHIPELYSVKIVDNLGEQPADFDSVNAAITRVAVMRKTLGARAVQNISKSSELELVGSYGPSEISFSDEAASFTSSNDFVRSPDGMMFADRMKRLAGAFDRNDEPAAAAAAGGGRQDDWAGATTPPAAMASEPNPDILRSHFIETCGDRNGLEMFWQRTIDRYRSGWRDYMKGSPATIETPKQRPMVVDMFTESMWQHRRNSSKQPL
ncbi:vacuolar membrane-associated protein iml1 [Coemansia sp. RSA 2399]|nr:vacuolar membrane-associated protein iml1 [Coemansia sp. RSA 2399]